MNNDIIEKPAHYTASNITCPHCNEPLECIDVARHFSFIIGNIFKYLWRHKLKANALEDLKKARKYIDFAIEEIEQKSTMGDGVKQWGN